MKRGRRVALVAVAALCGLAWLVRTMAPRARDVALAPVIQPEPVQPAATLATEVVESPAVAERSDVSTEARANVAEEAAALDPFRVRVTDRAGQPLAGARVRLLVNPRADDEYEVRITDAGGRCELDRGHQRAWPRLYLEVEKEGYFHVRHEFDAAAEVVITLEPSVKLFGQVLDAETRRVIPGASVAMRHDERCRWCEIEAVTAGPDGAYELPSVPPSEEGVYLSASANGYTTRALQMRTAGESSPLRQDFELVRGAQLSVRVVDFATRAPLERVRVSGGSRPGESGADGRVELTVARDREIVLHASFVDRRDVYCQVRARLGAEEVALGSVEIPMPRYSTLEGTVRDPEGRAIAAVVTAVPLSMRDEEVAADRIGLPERWTLQLDHDVSRAKSRADGSYRIEGLLPDAGEYSVWAHAATFVDATLQVRGSGRPGEALALDVTLQPMGGVARIQGRVTLNGEPVQATVIWQGPMQRSHAWTQEGRYEMRDVEAGAGSLRVSLESQERRLGSFPGSVVPLQLVAGEARLQDFALTLATISGHVRFADGRPAPGTQLRLWGGRRETHVEASATSDSDGSYRFEIPEENSYGVSAWSATGEYERRDDIAPGSTDVDFVLPETATLRYRVVDAETDASVGTHLFCWRRVGEAAWRSAGYTVPGARGVHEVQLPIGRVDLLACPSNAGYQPAFVRDLATGSSAGRVETIALARSLEVSFVLDPAPFPADHALLLLPAEDWEGVDAEGGRGEWHFHSRDIRSGYLAERRVLAITDGRATVRGFSPGPHHFKVFPDDLVVEPAEIELPLSSAAPITVRWSAR